MRALVGWRTAVLTVVLLAGACGNSDGGSGGDGDGGLRKLPLGAAASAGRSSATMSAEATADSATAMLAPLRAVEYRLAEDADPVPEEATAYEVKPLPADEVRSKIAEALEVDEDLVEVGALGYDWYYSGVAPDSPVSSSVSSSPACAPDEKCVDEAPPSPAPTVAGVPSAAEAERRVRDLLRSLGASLDGRFEVFGEDGYNRTVQFTPSIDGVPVAGLQTQIAFGGGGRIEYASGLLAEVESIGEYPLVGLAEAVKRLQEGFGSGGVQTMGAPEVDVAGDPAASGSGGGSSGSAGTGTATATATAEPGGAGDPSPPETAVDTPACAPGDACTTPPSPPTDEPTMTIEPQPAEPVEPEVVEITGAELSLQLVAAGCPGDPVYLVPAFDLLPGPAASVIAVEDDLIAGQGDDADAGDGAFEPCPGEEPAEVPMGRPEPAPMPADAGREPATNP